MHHQLTLAVAFVVFSVACHHHHRHPRSTSNAGSAAPEEMAGDREQEAERPYRAAAPVTGGDCNASCAHYLECKGSIDPNAQGVCVSRCSRMGLTPQQLRTYESSDCATAIWQAEHSGGGTSTGAARSSKCNGCVWDGSACIWLSQSNWGAGPYSGAASSCDASCCPGH
jgi:hypothetical protein